MKLQTIHKLLGSASIGIILTGSLLASATTMAQVDGGPQAPRANVAHLAPFADTLAGTEVSVEVEGTEVISSVVFNQSSGYLDLSSVFEGISFEVDVDVFAPPGAATPAISDTFDLNPDTDYTIAAVGNGTLQPLDFLLLDDSPVLPVRGDNVALLRIVHAAPFADNATDTEVSIRLQDGTVVAGLTNVPYGADSGFLDLPPGTYDLLIATPDGSTPLIDPLPVDLAAGDIFTVFAVGDIDNQPLGITLQGTDGSFTSLPLARGTPGTVSVPTLGTIGLLLMIGLLAFVAVRRFA
ncbi:MAG: DUF4397 domain-containing protein [Pseudomonadota bacterium]